MPFVDECIYMSQGLCLCPTVEACCEFFSCFLIRIKHPPSSFARKKCDNLFPSSHSYGFSTFPVEKQISNCGLHLFTLSPCCWLDLVFDPRGANDNLRRSTVIIQLISVPVSHTATHTHLRTNAQTYTNCPHACR